MNEYKNRRQLLCLAVTAGMMFTAVNVSSKTVWAAAEQVIEYDPVSYTHLTLPTILRV